MPFYNFNSFTSRLNETSHLQPLYPISSRPLYKSDPPKMIWDSVKTKPLQTATPSVSFSTLKPEMLEKYKKFQADVEKPVFLMGGAADKIKFRLTCGLVFVGVLQALYTTYKMATQRS